MNNNIEDIGLSPWGSSNILFSFHLDPFEQSLIKYASYEWREDVLFSHILKSMLNHNDYRKLNPFMNHGSFGFLYKYDEFITKIQCVSLGSPVK